MFTFSVFGLLPGDYQQILLTSESHPSA